MVSIIKLFLYHSLYFPSYLYYRIVRLIAIILLFDNDLFILIAMIYGIEQQ